MNGLVDLGAAAPIIDPLRDGHLPQARRSRSGRFLLRRRCWGSPMATAMASSSSRRMWRRSALHSRVGTMGAAEAPPLAATVAPSCRPHRGSPSASFPSFPRGECILFHKMVES